jgi:hypothetical protein
MGFNSTLPHCLLEWRTIISLSLLLFAAFIIYLVFATHPPEMEAPAAHRDNSQMAGASLQ